LPAASPAEVQPVDLDLSPALSIVHKAKHTLQGRKVGILFAEGSAKAEIVALRSKIRAAGGTAVLIAPHVVGVRCKGGTLDADGQLAGTPSVTVDAIAVMLTEAAAKQMCHDGAAVQFVMDAFAHLKAIAHTPGAAALLAKAGVAPGEGVMPVGAQFLDAACERFYSREPAVRALA
jgi:catalase